MSKLKIVATIVVKPEFTENILNVLHTLTDATRKEDGNISYKLHRDVKNHSKFIILEEWKSQDAINYHNQTPHFRAFEKALDGKVDLLTIDVTEEIY